MALLVSDQGGHIGGYPVGGNQGEGDQRGGNQGRGNQGGANRGAPYGPGDPRQPAPPGWQQPHQPTGPQGWQQPGQPTGPQGWPQPGQPTGPQGWQQPAPQQGWQQPGQPQTPPSAAASKNRTPMIVTAIAVVVALLAGAGVWFFAIRDTQSASANN